MKALSMDTTLCIGCGP